MTANQIALAANQIERDKLAETNRHNEEVEAETARSNKAQEDLRQRANEIERLKAEYENTYRTEANRIQEEYNRLYLEWQRAQGEAKLAIESQLAVIEMHKAENDRKYKENMARVAGKEADIAALRQIEDEFSHRNNEKLQEWKLSIDEQANYIHDKQVEYQNTYWTGSLFNQSTQIQNQASYWTLDLANQQKTIQNNYDLGILALERDYANTQIKAYQAKMDTHFRNWASVANTVNSIFSGTRSMINPYSWQTLGGRR